MVREIYHNKRNRNWNWGQVTGINRDQRLECFENAGGTSVILHNFEKVLKMLATIIEKPIAWYIYKKIIAIVFVGNLCRFIRWQYKFENLKF